MQKQIQIYEIETFKGEVNALSLKMKLVAEILTGNLFYVEVGDDATVGDLKKEIGNQENLPIDRLILMLDADQHSLLDSNEVSLKEYLIEDGSHIYLFFEFRDEGLSSSPYSVPQTPQVSVSNNQTHSGDVSCERLDTVDSQSFRQER